MTTDTLVRQEIGTAAQPKLQIVDADVHPYMRSPGDLDPYLSERWQKHRKTYRENVRRAFASTRWRPASFQRICAARVHLTRSSRR